MCWSRGAEPRTNPGDPVSPNKLNSQIVIIVSFQFWSYWELDLWEADSCAHIHTFTSVHKGEIRQDNSGDSGAPFRFPLQSKCCWEYCSQVPIVLFTRNCPQLQGSAPPPNPRSLSTPSTACRQWLAAAEIQLCKAAQLSTSQRVGWSLYCNHIAVQCPPWPILPSLLPSRSLPAGSLQQPCCAHNPQNQSEKIHSEVRISKRRWANPSLVSQVDLELTIFENEL